MSDMQIGYLLGAGASCNALPIVSNMPERLNKARAFLASDKTAIKAMEDNNAETILEDFKWIYEKARQNFSVDTFAKKLFIQNKADDLRRLKIILTIYFLMEQMLNYGQGRVNYIDMRYDTFFASIIGDKDDPAKLPDNIKIFSWNYDSQIEMSARNFFPNLEPLALLKKLQSYPISTEYKNNIDDSKFAVIKLNGTATALHDKNGLGSIPDLCEDLSRYNISELISRITELYQSLKKHKVLNPSQAMLNFAWEDGIWQKIFIPQAVNIMKQIDILIVIGYSFPFFNREIDKQLLSNINLTKIYLQVPAEYHKAFSDRIHALTNDKPLKIIPLNDIKQFFIPYEF